MLKIIQAISDTHINQVKEMFIEYANNLNIDLEFQDFKQELNNLPGDYSPPTGRLLLAYYKNKLAGCIALRKFNENICEMKRLYIRKEFRSKGIEKALSNQVIKVAIKIKYNYMQLDTLPNMKQAISLYKSLGFKKILPYRYNPIKGAKFFQLKLI